MDAGVTACLGPEGSYSELAAKKLGAREIVLCDSFYEAAEKLSRGETQSAVLPIENTIQGAVLQNLDILAQSELLFAVRELVLPVDHRLALREGVRIEEVERVYSHEQAIGQCAGFLRRELPRAQILFTRSTAQSLDMLDGSSAGIVGSHVQRAGVVLSRANIADEKNNFTHFLLFRRGGEGLAEHTQKIFLCMTLAHRPNALQSFLRVLGERGINLTKIESRPIRGVPGEYRFFVEFEGDHGDPALQEAIACARTGCSALRILGAY